MSPEATFYNGVWSLPAASKNDAAEYKCVARNNVGRDEKTTILYVQGTVKVSRMRLYLKLLNHMKITV